MATRRGRPPVLEPPTPPPAWESEGVAKQVQDILDALEASAADAATRSMFCRWLYRWQKFPEVFRNEPYRVEEKIVLVCRAILESNGNGGDALIEPIVSAVSSCMRPQWTSKGIAWIEAFDQISLLDMWQTLAGLLGEKSAAEHLPEALRRKLWQIFGPDVTAAPAKVKAPTKPPARVTRVPLIERRIAMGMQLLELRAKSRRNNDYSQLRKKHFGDVEPKLAMQVVSVAKRYGARPEIYRAVSWRTLTELSSPSLSPAARLRFETAIVAGEDVNGWQVKLARGRLRGGRPGRGAGSAARMAA